MKDIAASMDFEIVYGGTDSYSFAITALLELPTGRKLFQECRKQLAIELEHTKTYQRAIISEKKKHYIGWTGIEGNLDIIGMEGDKNDRPQRINTVFRHWNCP